MLKKGEKKRISKELISFEHLDYGGLRDLHDRIREYLSVVEKSNKNIPLCVFSLELSGLETIVKYLKENIKLEFKEISVILGRSVKTIWQAYSYSKKKHPDLLVADDFSLTIPVLLFKDRRLSVLEHIVCCLRERGMKFSRIARALKRDPRTIWTVYSRAKEKNVR